LARTGIITTATGLLFHAGLDRKVRAYDAETGRVLWVGDLPSGSVGVPAMYQVNGKQYLLVSATQGAGRGGAGATPTEASAAPAAESPRAYVAFALP
jgi:quinoprotein glucose dehydrogenase